MGLSSLTFTLIIVYAIYYKLSTIFYKYYALFNIFLFIMTFFANILYVNEGAFLMEGGP